MYTDMASYNRILKEVIEKTIALDKGADSDRDWGRIRSEHRPDVQTDEDPSFVLLSGEARRLRG